MSSAPRRLPPERAPADPVDDALVDRILRGAIDLHCHSGPSVMPRRLDHIEAIEQAAAAGMRGLLFKDHYYSATPIVELLRRHYGDRGVAMFSGVALNNAVGGFNRYAVDHMIKLGGQLVWMPTFSSANHLHHHDHDKDFDRKFPTTKEKMLAPTPLSVLDDAGRVRDEVKFILDMVAEHDLILSGGHLHVGEIHPLFAEARARGVRRLLVNHPTYVIDATLDDIRELASAGAYMEHSVCMFVEGSKFKFYEPGHLRALIEAAGVGRTILGSDLGQVGNPTPVEGFRAVIRLALGTGYSPAEVHAMIADNPAHLLGLDVEPFDP
ncbi:DUF6282 family protein [Luteimonas sp. Y-2-2-4F]|nr:DUF6282 family protein [Luteimonas sp. Y-2-2-4F]MCD9030259.1 DUF6282 family protein [Luteimonas sp. Y-2-2-4F]